MLLRNVRCQIHQKLITIDLSERNEEFETKKDVAYNLKEKKWCCSYIVIELFFFF